MDPPYFLINIQIQRQLNLEKIKQYIKQKQTIVVFWAYPCHCMTSDRDYKELENKVVIDLTLFLKYQLGLLLLMHQIQTQLYEKKTT